MAFIKMIKSKMIRVFSIGILALYLSLASVLAQGVYWAEEKTQICSAIEQKSDYYSELAHSIWELAEVGYQEYQSSALLQQSLTSAGFSVTPGVADIPTAFIASYGEGTPVIAILAEFDALPGVSQDAVPFRQKREEVQAGHACGHHLFGAGSTAAAIAVKEWMESTQQKGTIRLYGTPAEEGGAGKVYMVREGLFDDVDAVLHWHPGSANGASAASSLANKSAKFRFHGIASHAAAAPERGRSALDAVEAMNFMVNSMREHIPSEARIHYVITSGGEAPNVVPEFAEVFYYVRHPKAAVVHQLFERVANAAKGAALGTETTVDYEIIHGLFNLLPNETLAEIMFDNLTHIGGVAYNSEELAFAEKIAESFEFVQPDLKSAGLIAPYTVENTGKGGSTDVGDVSWVVPTVGMRAATWVPGTSAHTWQAVAAGGMTIGHKGMIVAAKTLATTAIDLFQNEEFLTKAKKELTEKRGLDWIYQPLLGDRNPPLDYRK
jgi:aminobenzoyl-glutamate utilization protein B